MPKGDRLYNEDLEDLYALNTTKAKQLLAEAGYPNGFESTMLVQAGDAQRLGEIIQPQWAAIGVKVNPMRPGTPKMKMMASTSSTGAVLSVRRGPERPLPPFYGRERLDVSVGDDQTSSTSWMAPREMAISESSIPRGRRYTSWAVTWVSTLVGTPITSCLSLVTIRTT